MPICRKTTMVDPDKAPILAAVAAVASEDAPVPAPAPAAASEPAPEPVDESASEPVAKTEFTSRVQSLVDKLADSNPAFRDLQSKVYTLLTGKGYIESLLAKATDDSAVADSVRMALGRLGITNSVLEDLPSKRFITVTATHINVVEKVRGDTPRVIFYKETDSTITVYWKNAKAPRENKYKDITDRSADDVRLVAAVLAVNKRDVDMGPLGIMEKFMKDTNVPKELQSTMEDVLRQMGVDAKTLYTMKDNTYITFNGKSYIALITIHIIKSNGTFQLVSKLPESLSSVKPLQMITSITVNPPTGSKVVSGTLIKLLDFIHKQSMAGGTARHNLPHRPAKKTRRRHRSSNIRH